MYDCSSLKLSLNLTFIVVVAVFAWIKRAEWASNIYHVHIDIDTSYPHIDGFSNKYLSSYQWAEWEVFTLLQVMEREIFTIL